MSNDLVFTTLTGTNRDPRNFNRSFDSRCDKAGVRRIRVHDTRHTCASLLAALDVHPRVAMAILRHAQIAITMEIYTEVPDEVTRAALKRLGDQSAAREPSTNQAPSWLTEHLNSQRGAALSSDVLEAGKAEGFRQPPQNAPTSPHIPEDSPPALCSRTGSPLRM